MLKWITALCFLVPVLGQASLVVTGVESAVSESSFSGVVDFGYVGLGEATPAQLTLTNTGPAALHHLSGYIDNREFQFTGGYFPGEYGSCTASLQPGMTCTIEIEYRPITVGVATGFLDVSFQDGAGQQNLNIQLRGVSHYNIATLTISDGPAFNFGPVGLGFSEDKVFEITNHGAGVAHNIQVALLSPPFNLKGGYFPGSGGTCERSLAPRATCMIVVSFSPRRNGVFSEQIEIHFNDVNPNKIVTRDLIGTGVLARSSEVTQSLH